MKKGLIILAIVLAVLAVGGHFVYKYRENIKGWFTKTPAQIEQVVEADSFE